MCVCLWSHIKYGIFKCYHSSLSELLLHHCVRGHTVCSILFVQFPEIKQIWEERGREKRKQPPALLPRGTRTLGLTLRHNSSQLELNYIGDLGLPYIIDTLTDIPSDTEIYIRQQKRKPVRGYLCPPNWMSVSTTCYSENSGKHMQIKRKKLKDS